MKVYIITDWGWQDTDVLNVFRDVKRTQDDAIIKCKLLLSKRFGLKPDSKCFFIRDYSDNELVVGYSKEDRKHEVFHIAEFEL